MTHFFGKKGISFFIGHCPRPATMLRLASWWMAEKNEKMPGTINGAKHFCAFILCGSTLLYQDFFARVDVDSGCRGLGGVRASSDIKP